MDNDAVPAFIAGCVTALIVAMLIIWISHKDINTIKKMCDEANYAVIGDKAYKCVPVEGK